jgi:gluconate 2-dehydrogenase gamma chain
LKSTDDPRVSRRSFLLSSGETITAAWLAAQWPVIAAAAQHAEHTAAAPAELQFFNAADAADVAAICEQIIPGGETPGAREARVVNFIDRSLATYFAKIAPGFAAGLQDFQKRFEVGSAGKSFAASGGDAQIAFLKTVDSSPFFESTRMLTVLGLLASPKYGGNYQGLGWKMLGFEDLHAFAPPFGYYDREYAGFVPYPAKA